MGGLVAGTAILSLNAESDSVRMVALTVNNSCNLKCPHCYLQYAGPKSVIRPEVVQAVLAASYEHLSIVGMEPFLNNRSVATTCDVAERAKASGKTTSVITNGLGLRLIPRDNFRYFDFFDVSLDGGPASYDVARNAQFSNLVSSLRYAADAGASLRIINTLHNENLKNIDDMLQIEQVISPNLIMFAPYFPSANHGVTSVTRAPTIKIMQTLMNSPAFTASAISVLLIDAYHFSAGTEDVNLVASEARRLNMQNRLHMVPFTPLRVGTLRVTYDGLVMSPATAIHPQLYTQNSLRIEDTDLGEAYTRYCEQERTANSTPSLCQAA